MSDRRPSARVEKDLRESIASGYYAPGQQLPSIRALSSRYGIARQTVANVLNQLRTEGLIEGHRGAGVFVSERPSVEPEMRFELEKTRSSRPYQVERVRARVATAEDSHIVDVHPGSPVLVITRTQHDQYGEATESSSLLLPGDRYELVYELAVSTHTESAPADPAPVRGQKRDKDPS